VIENKTAAPPVPYAELSEAEKEAIWKALMADWDWVYEQMNQGAFNEYGGELIVVHDRKVLGHARNGLGLEKRIAEQFGLYEQQLSR
jgi:hypothetical protein